MASAVRLTGQKAQQVESRYQRHRRRRNVHRYGFRQIMDDWDYFWLVDEPSNLTRYDIRDAD